MTHARTYTHMAGDKKTKCVFYAPVWLRSGGGGGGGLPCFTLVATIMALSSDPFLWGRFCLMCKILYRLVFGFFFWRQ